MKKFLSISLVALALTAGCRDEQERPNAAPATVAERITAPSYSASGAAPRSTVCVAYDDELVRVREQLTQTPDDEELKQTLASVETVLANSCKE
jgi:hypothetical protein